MNTLRDKLCLDVFKRVNSVWTQCKIKAKLVRNRTPNWRVPKMKSNTWGQGKGNCKTQYIKALWLKHVYLVRVSFVQYIPTCIPTYSVEFSYSLKQAILYCQKHKTLLSWRYPTNRNWSSAWVRFYLEKFQVAKLVQTLRVTYGTRTFTTLPEEPATGSLYNQHISNTWVFLIFLKSVLASSPLTHC
jgi:hypothetical protein